MAACITGALFVSNMMYQNSTIVKVNDVPISYLNVNVGNEDTDVPFTISECRNKEIQSEIPMEINISGNAHIEVSEGYIRRQETSEDSNEKVTQLDIEGKTVILWNMAEDMNPIATCTITTEETRYQYVLEMKESSWKLRLKEKN